MKINKQRRLLSYETDDNFLVNALLITPESETEEDLYETPIIINVHGVLGNFLARGTPQILPPALLKYGYSSLSINTRMGFLGQIFGEGLFHLAIKEISESVKVLKEEGFRNIYILGYSSGANLAVYYASQVEDHGIKGLILEGCSFSLPESQKNRLDKWNSIPKYDVIYNKAKRILGPNPAECTSDQIFIVYRAWGPSFDPIDIEMFTYKTWWFMRSPEAYHAITSDLITEVDVPILFIHGQIDDIVYPWEAEKLLKILRDDGREDVDFKIIPDAKHDCMENPEGTLEAIITWLQKYDTGQTRALVKELINASQSSHKVN